uniref:ShKT domain-containing protein n=1 Tax=Ditylenchus dipsaci TaxID=166011 RepID=A0A915ESG4_9BILA
MRRLKFDKFAGSVVAWMCLSLLPANAQDGSSELTPDKATSTLAGRMRVRCTDDNLRLYANATACADERSQSLVVWCNPAARDPKCDNPLLKDLTDQCRRTCATCCEDPSYSCQNDESGIVNCNQNMEKWYGRILSNDDQVLSSHLWSLSSQKCKDQIEDCESMKSLCTNEIYATFMEHQCSRTCGKCKVEDSNEDSEENNQGGEEDVDEDTEEEVEQPPPKRGKPAKGGKETTKGDKETSTNSIGTLKKVGDGEFIQGEFIQGHHPSYKEMMKRNCAKTCGYCKPKRGSPPSRVINQECKDNHPFCKGWAANGYCESDEYTDEEKKEKCAKTCGYC